jgi:hypothetical protein
MNRHHRFFGATIVFATQALAAPVTPPPEVNYKIPTVSDRAVLPAEARRATDEAVRQREQLGYVDRGSAPIKSEFALRQLRNRQAQLAAGEISRERKGFFTAEEYASRSSVDGLSRIPPDVVSRSSEIFVIPAGGVTRGMFTDTEFGLLLVEESISSLEFFAPPNLRIADHDAIIATARHTEGWATTIVATDGRKSYYIEANRRLSETQRSRFVDVARRLVEGKIQR